MFGIVFFVEVIRGECGRFDGFDVPCVEVLVGKKTEQLGIVFIGISHACRWQPVPVRKQGGAVGMFQTAIYLFTDMEQEQIFFKWGRGGKHCQFSFADSLEV